MQSFKSEYLNIEKSTYTIMNNLQEEPNYYIHKLAYVETQIIGSGTRILAFAVVSADVKIGDNVVIHPHVTIESGVTIGNGVEIFPGAYIGKEPKGAGATARPI